MGGGIPYIAYTLVALGHDALLANGLVGATPPTIPILYYSLGFGIPGLCALATLRRLRALRHAPAAMVLLWSVVAANVLLLATRVGQNGHGGEGMGLALSPLAAWALVHEILPRFWRTGAFRAAVRRRLFGYSRPRLRLLSLNLVLILSSPSVLALAFATPRAGLASAGEIYMTGDDLAATAWIRGNVGSNDIVVAAPESAQLVAAYGGARVAFGTRYYTPDYDGEATRLLAFFREPATSQRYLAERSVGWVYFGPREAGVATYDPASMPYLVAAYTTGRTTIYRVKT